MPELNAKTQQRLHLLALFSVVIVLTAVLLPPVAQSHGYHDFSDKRQLLGIPNFMNVVSNVAILFSGIAGLNFLRQVSGQISGRDGQHPQAVFQTAGEIWPYRIFFLSIVATALGSAYYHWHPDNATLLWDRMSIAIAVTALLAAVLTERVNSKTGVFLLPLLVLMGTISVIYWYWSEQQGTGNLNFYIVIQFYSLLLIIILSLMLPTNYTHGNMTLQAIGLYALAKVAETFDRQLYALGEIVSGHTLKHLIAALAIWWIVRMLRNRTLVSTDRAK